LKHFPVQWLLAELASIPAELYQTQSDTFSEILTLIPIPLPCATVARDSDDPDCRKDHAVQWLLRLRPSYRGTTRPRSAGYSSGLSQNGPCDVYIYLADLSNPRGSCSCCCMCCRPRAHTFQLRGPLLLRLTLSRHVLLRPPLRPRHVPRNAQATDHLLLARCL
jgi:hypothetical protein